METIKKLIEDPGWWVTAVFVGLIVSVIAGFLKDAISNTLATSSSRFRHYRDDKRSKFLHEANKLSRDFGFILYARLQALTSLVLWSAMIMTMLATFILWRFSEANRTQLLIGLIATGGYSFFPYFSCIRHMRLANEAKKIYTKREFPDEFKTNV
jgi:hypothetical protein